MQSVLQFIKIFIYVKIVKKISNSDHKLHCITQGIFHIMGIELVLAFPRILCIKTNVGFQIKNG